ncbi:MAG TPA: T9SS type A sorting domain-containing protein, partial [Flavisolibacter sp.]|nr:T9SS type A sorting domain-containing protein [Flavisolibacter sp.]
GIAYSGNNALTLDNSYYNPSGNVNYLMGTYNLTNYNVASNDVRLDFQFNNHGQVSNSENRVWVRGNDAVPWILAYDLDANENDPGGYKKSASIELSRLLSANGQDYSTSFQVKWGQFGQLPATDFSNAAGYTFDDIRLYQAINDLQLKSIDSPAVSACGLTNATTITITVRNSSNSTLLNIPVRYRVNGGSWISETIPSLAGNTSIQHNFSITADLSAFTTYAIQGLVDYPGDNFRENDTLTISVINSPVINTFPYLENFEGGNGYWYSAGKKNSWGYGTPNSPKINRSASGAKAWKTNLTGNYNDYELSYLYSPCFNISTLTNPTLSFNVALDLEDCGGSLCDGAWVEYSTDGKQWIKLGALGNGTNWYNKVTDSLWSIRDYTRWHVATIPLPAGLTNLHIRFVMNSDPATNYEGIAVDDIHIYDNIYGIYPGPASTSPITQSVSGNNWIHFLTPGNKLIASIQPNNLNLGTTNVQSYININNGNVRHTYTQYYHDRNITIKPQFRNLTDSVTVRFYFMDTETDSLIQATGCASCSKPSNVEELGISQYSDSDTTLENGTIADDYHAIWSFITPGNVIKVPFDKGYYAEFKVKDFSEFWLNNGGFSNTFPLPVNLLDFTVQRQGANDVAVNWTVGAEINVSKYDIELATGANPSSSAFIKIGSVTARNTTGTQNYNFIDGAPNKSGIRYYRVKTVNTDGSYSYSPIKSVKFELPVEWQVYPNPSDGIFNLVVQTNGVIEGTIKVMDSKGSLVKEEHFTGNGSAQKISVDLSANNFAKGVYMLQVTTQFKTQLFKLYKM